MPCDYPHCVGGQSGTVCRDECKSACHGPCLQGKVPCPTPDACERPEQCKPVIPSFVLAAMLVATIFLVLWVLS